MQCGITITVDENLHWTEVVYNIKSYKYKQQSKSTDDCVVTPQADQQQQQQQHWDKCEL